MKYFTYMLQNSLKNISDFYNRKNRWWLPLLSGIPFSISLPPFNHEFHPLFALFPFFSFFTIIPLLFFATRKPFRKSLLHSYLASYTIALSQCFWVAFVKIEGLWGIIIVGMFLLAAYVALFYWAAALIFRVLFIRFPRLYPFLFPAFWIIIDYSRTFSDIAFPWGFVGYNLTPILPLSQLASITGVWGLTFLIVLANTLLFDSLRKFVMHTKVFFGTFTPVIAVCAASIIFVIWGSIRIAHIKCDQTAKIAIVQPNLDQLNWGNYSIDKSFEIFDTLIYKSAESKPKIIICPESSLLCYLSRQRTYRKKVQKWVDSIQIPILIGSLHWDKPKEGSIYDYLVYNTAFLATPGDNKLSPYRKIKLVPFSEIFPFEANFPILSRVNLGEADFKRGEEETVFSVDSHLTFAPFVCYEIIFPEFVRRRVRKNVNLIAHITNDGWFGNTSGPYEHAEMARMRAIENCTPIARCAITGISMFIDPAGRITNRTSLAKREIIVEEIGLKKADTFYNRHGDWFIILCFITVFAVISVFIAAIFFKKK